MVSSAFIQLILRVAVLTIFGISAHKDDIYKNECEVWDDEIRRIYETEPRVNVKCKVNPQCTGFDCSGKYTYNSPLLTGGNDYVKEICFGLWLNPCATGATPLTVYFEQKTDNISFTHVFIKDGHDDVNVPGVEEDINLPIVGKAGTATLTLEAHVNHTTLHGKPYMTIGLKMKPKVNVAGGRYEEYPSDMQVALVKDVGVPVPNCDKNVPETTHKPHTCVNVTGNGTHGTPATSTQCTNGTTKLQSKILVHQCVNTSDLGILYSKCVPGSFGTCSSLKNGGCIVHDEKKQYYCDCGPHFQRATNGTCVIISEDPNFIPVITEPPTTTGTNTSNATNEKHSISKSTVIIVSCTIGAIALALLAAGFVFWKYRAHRERYGGHQLLSNNEDPDDDDDVPPINL